MEAVTGEIRDMSVRLIVIDNDGDAVIQETRIESADEIEVAMIESVTKHLVKRATARVEHARKLPVNRNQLRLMEGE